MTMTFEEVESGQSKEMPARTVIYGVPKIGKSRFAAQYPDVFFINIEGGLEYLDRKVRSTPKLKTYDEVIAWLRHIYESEDFTCGTIAIDSLDWLENLSQAKLIKQYNAKNINDPMVKDFAFFKGVLMAADDAITVFKWLDAIHEKKGINAVLIAHSTVKNIDLPDKDAYARHELKLSKSLAAKVSEWADLILFADYSFHVSKETGKTSTPNPVLFAGGSAAFVGGGRMSLSKEIPLNYDQLKKEITND